MAGNYWAPSSKEFNPSSSFAQRIYLPLTCFYLTLAAMCMLAAALFVGSKQCYEMINAFWTETQLVVVLVYVVALMT